MSNPELAFLPWEGMGHLVPMVELAKLMLERNQILSISILVMRTSMDFGADKYLDSVTSDSGHPRLRFLDLRQYNDPEDAGGEVVLNPDNFLFDFIHSQTAHVRRFAQTNYADSECDRPRLVGFVIDMFCAPMIDVANEFSVPTYLFFASSIGFLGLSLHFQALKHDHKEDTSRYKNSDEELSIPYFANPVRGKVLPSPMVEKNPATDMFFDGVKRYKETKGIMVNTFGELEHYALQALSDTKTVPPVYPVGPLLNLEAGHGRNKASQSESIMKWLDDQPTSSVVFLCFGSFGSFEEKQVTEIATALELSGHRFLWSLRRRPPKGKLELPADYENPAEVLPEGFLERTKAVGKVIGWAPQLAVLSHPAVGGFVSHCGWNSLLESIWCGVPIATWPLYAEQQINAFWAIKEVGIAAEIRMDYNVGGLGGNEEDNIVTAEEIRKGIMEIMSNGDIRKKVKEMKEMSRKAMIEGGLSYTALDTLLKAVIDTI
ncbi:PREDICTED: anthocyanidin 3-O-glucosyltransferase 2-like [Ipomoea nil]|uniref:anthocyanidin 3-O-glucosyltransferase 2-like n=1 Tax=Ipomoea nil TaxID=35883 RepID=UPI0009009476|nr:PREDICTED: anthocyanidin 3-O-glucosyltransferase 2-like [Ipomoea nil]